MAMQVKRYEAPSLRDAFQQIKTELGSEAVIVHSQPIRQGGWHGWFRHPRFEVIAAVDRDSIPLSRTERGLLAEEKRMLAEMKQGLSDLRNQMDELSRYGRTGAPRWATPSLAELYQRLIAQEMEPALARELMQAVEGSLSLAEAANPAAVRACAAQSLRKWVKVSGPLRLAPGRSHVIMLVGPTGVGKTTTAAKLAANFAMEDRGSVALITTDTFRVAAIPQLQTYAEIIGVPLEVAYTPSELLALTRRHADKSLILVDTPGRGQHNQERLAELRGFVESVPEGSALLALDASTKHGDLLETVRAFGSLPLTGLLMTKLDETASFGSLASLPRQTGKPLTYFTTGQNVPQDIALASVDEVIQLLLGGRGN